MNVSVYFDELRAFPIPSGPPTEVEYRELSNRLVGYDPYNSAEPLFDNIRLIEKENHDESRRDTVPGSKLNRDKHLQQNRPGSQGGLPPERRS